MAASGCKSRKQKGRLRDISCLFVTMEDIYVILCLLVSLASLVLCLLSGFNAFGAELWRRLYTSVVIGLGCALCFLQAVPSWRVRSFTPHLIGGAAILSLGSAVGLLLSLLWDRGWHGTVDEMKGFTFGSDDDGLRDFVFPDVPQYADSAAFMGCLGAALALLSAIHEFFLKYDNYPRRQPCKYLVFLITVGITGVYNTALGLMTINPELKTESVVLGKDVDFGNAELQPTVLMASLRFGACAAVVLLLFRRRKIVIVMAEILIIFMTLCHCAMTAFSFINFKVGGEWESFPNTTVGILFSSTTVLLIVTTITAFCCAPSSKNNKPQRRIEATDRSSDKHDKHRRPWSASTRDTTTSALSRNAQSPSVLHGAMLAVDRNSSPLAVSPAMHVAGGSISFLHHPSRNHPINVYV